MTQPDDIITITKRTANRSIEFSLIALHSEERYFLLAFFLDPFFPAPPVRTALGFLEPIVRDAALFRP